MATQTIEFLAVYGQTLTAKLFAVGSDTLVQTASAVAEQTNRIGVYRATFTDAPAGEYELHVATSGGIPVARWYVTLTLTTATFASYDTTVRSVTARVTANTDQWGGASVTGMPMPTYAQPAGFLAATFPAAVSSYSGGAVASVTARVTANTDQWGGVAVTGMPMPTYAQPAGFLAATFPGTVSSYAGGAVASVTGAVGSVASPVTVGANNDKTGYSLTQSFPANFATLGINGSGHVSRVTLVDTTTTNTDMRGTNGAALASAWTATRAAYMDSVLLAVNSNRTVQVTGSNHIAADIHELQAAVITADKFAANWLTAAGTAADYITEIQTGLATSANQTTILDRQGYMLAVLAGTISDAQTAAETYAITLGANTFTVDFSGLDSSGNRAGQTLTKV